MNDEMILEKLLTPEQNDAGIERRNEEKRRQVKEMLGIQRSLSIPPNTAQFRLIPPNTAFKK
jgi:hypothetical protein